MTLTRAKQLPLMIVEKPQFGTNESEWGTFKDSLRAPIHNWFTYPAGFSYKAVEASFKSHKVNLGDYVYDPFMGSGTTNLTAKKLGINSYGVEAHPFVYNIARTKLNWEIARDDVVNAFHTIEEEVKNRKGKLDRNVDDYLSEQFPELILKCFDSKPLLDLLLIRNALESSGFSAGVYDFLRTGLTALLRQISSVATGWPYIAPKKKKTTSAGKDALAEYSRILSKMVADVEIMAADADPHYKDTAHHLFNADARNTRGLIPDGCADHVFTSPPYLNNFDYADRTRLEMYFFGEAKTWDDITQSIRTKLITSATTQISRNDARYNLSEDIANDCPEVYDFLSDAIKKLSQIRSTKGGKKSYDLLVAGYFNDMHMIMKDVFRILKPGKVAVFVLGDSAPYGVHIPTDDFMGKVGVGVGFSDYKIDVLRLRGDKWRNNPQRHSVKLKESIVTLVKA